MPNYNTSRNEDVLDYIKSLEKRIEILEKTNPLNNSTIDRGGLTVKSGNVTILDDNGDAQVRLGALLEGGYGLEQLTESGWVTLAALAGGAVADSAPGEDSIDTGSGDSGWRVSTPVVTFRTYTGRFLLIVSAAWVAVPDGAFALLSYSLSGAQTRAPAESRSAAAGSIGGLFASQTYVEVINGEPGEVTVSPQIRRLSGSSAAWSNRTVVVIPY